MYVEHHGAGRQPQTPRWERPTIQVLPVAEVGNSRVTPSAPLARVACAEGRRPCEAPRERCVFAPRPKGRERGARLGLGEADPA